MNEGEHSGRVMGVRFTEAEDGEGLDAQPIAGNPNALATMPMPINVMIVDATGQANCAFGAAVGSEDNRGKPF
jgi:hypothetical protein